MLRAKFDSNWHGGAGEEDENVKSLRQQRRQRLLEPSAQMSLKREKKPWKKDKKKRE